MDLPHRLFTGDVQRLYRDLLAAEVASGGVPDFGAATALVYGGSNVDGVSSLVSRADHKHALAFPDVGDLIGFPGGTTDFLRADGTFAAPAGSGGTVWDGRVVPSGLHSSSDEFQTDTIGSGKWALWDPGSAYSIAVDTTQRRMRFTRTSVAAAALHVGAYQAVPSNEFTFLARVANDGAVNTAAPGMGIMVGEDLAGAPLTTDFATVDFVPRRHAASGGIFTRALTIYTSTAVTSSRLYEGPTFAWVRMRVTITPGTPATVCRTDYSSDGVTWTGLTADMTVGYAAKHFGLWFFDSTGTTTFSGVMEHFRVFDGVSGFNSTMNGGYL